MANTAWLTCSRSRKARISSAVNLQTGVRQSSKRRIVRLSIESGFMQVLCRLVNGGLDVALAGPRLSHPIEPSNTFRFDQFSPSLVRGIRQYGGQPFP